MLLAKSPRHLREIPTRAELLLFLAPIIEQMREVLAKHVQKALMRIFLQLNDRKLAARHFEETFQFVHLKEHTILTTYEEQHTLSATVYPGEGQ